MRIATIVIAAAAALTATIGAAAERAPTRSFQHGGRTYTYTQTEAAGGRQVIQGRSLPGNQRFRLVVSGTRVAGTVGTAPVDFRLNEARGASEGLILASAD